MKNLKINTKFIVSFGLILVLFLVSVIATCSGIAISKGGYQSFYEEEFVAVTTVQDVKTKLQDDRRTGIYAEIADCESEYLRYPYERGRAVQDI